MSILSLYERFAFTVLPYQLAEARNVILEQAAVWGRTLEIDRPAPLDVRLIYDSPDGPQHLPSVRTGLLLTEVVGPAGIRTLFVSNVADGYLSMVHMISKRVQGLHLSVSVSRLSSPYPRNAITAITANQVQRVVYSMRDDTGWDFFERGIPLPFEDVRLYRARLKRERLTPEIIAGYLKGFGYGSLDENFWVCGAAPAHLLCDGDFRVAGERNDDS